jgi:hypothetical protein
MYLVAAKFLTTKVHEVYKSANRNHKVGISVFSVTIKKWCSARPAHSAKAYFLLEAVNLKLVAYNLFFVFYFEQNSPVNLRKYT